MSQCVWCKHPSADSPPQHHLCLTSAAACTACMPCRRRRPPPQQLAKRVGRDLEKMHFNEYEMLIANDVVDRDALDATFSMIGGLASVVEDIKVGCLVLAEQRRAAARHC
jgi:hypothetical protein